MRLYKFLASALFVVSVAPFALSAQQAPNGTFYMGTYANKIMVIDEATLAVRDSIPLSIGIPYRMLLSENRQHFYILNPRSDQVEIVDIATRKATGKFTLSTPRTIVEIGGMNVDPKERYAVLLIKSTIKRADRFEITRPILVRYDLAKRAVTDTIPWPKGEERDNAQIIFSPDGAYMYFFTSTDVLVYDAATLKQVDTWDLTQSFFEEGMGRINAGFGGDIYEEPGFYTNIFRSTDPVNHRAMMGVARSDPWTSTPSARAR
jgi:DNA-binding beta-propeller fold protein YncE